MMSAVGGVGSSNSMDMGLISMQNSIDRMRGLLQNMIDAQGKISQNFQKQLDQAEREMQQLQKRLDKKNLPKLEQKIKDLSAQLDRTIDKLETSGKLDDKTRAQLDSLRKSVDELKRQAALKASNITGGGPVSSGGVDSGTVV